MKKCLLDMDGVLAHFVKGVCQRFNKNDPYHGDNLGSWDITQVFGIDPESFWSSFDYQFWTNLEPLPDAHQIVELLEASFGVENICILSSPVRTNIGECVTGKVDWLKKHFPQYSRRFLFGRMKSFCASPTTYLVDDYHKNVRMFREAGGHACLIPRAWSSNFKYRHECIDYLERHLEEWF